MACLFCCVVISKMRGLLSATLHSVSSRSKRDSSGGLSLGYEYSTESKAAFLAFVSISAGISLTSNPKASRASVTS